MMKTKKKGKLHMNKKEKQKQSKKKIDFKNINVTNCALAAI